MSTLPIMAIQNPEPVEDDWTGLLKVKLWSQKISVGATIGWAAVTGHWLKGMFGRCHGYLDYLGVDTDPKRYNQLLGLRGGYQYVVENGIKYANMYWKYPGVLFPDPKIQRDD